MLKPNLAVQVDAELVGQAELHQATGEIGVLGEVGLPGGEIQQAEIRGGQHAHAAYPFV